MAVKLDSHGSALQQLDLEGEGASRLYRLPCPALKLLTPADCTLVPFADVFNSIAWVTPLTSLTLHRASCHFPDLAAVLLRLPRLQHLTCDCRMHCGDIHLPALPHLSHLTYLEFRGRVTDASVQNLGTLKQLQHLELWFTARSACTSAAAAGLCQLEQLTALCLLEETGGLGYDPGLLPDFGGMTDQLGQLTELQPLQVSWTYSDGMPPSAIAAMTGLTSLGIHMAFDEHQLGAGQLLAALPTLHQLQRLDLHHIYGEDIPSSTFTALTAGNSALTFLSLTASSLPPGVW
jgi:hypothetical protein